MICTRIISNNTRVRIIVHNGMSDGMSNQPVVLLCYRHSLAIASTQTLCTGGIPLPQGTNNVCMYTQ